MIRIIKEQKQDIKDVIIGFLQGLDSVNDEKIHQLSDSLGIDTHKFEGKIYEILMDILQSGKIADEDKVDPKELEMGIKIEKEHTKLNLVSKKIALNHLAEFKNYYSMLLFMEELLKKGMTIEEIKSKLK